jgi:hypothetical protein
MVSEVPCKPERNPKHFYMLRWSSIILETKKHKHKQKGRLNNPKWFSSTHGTTPNQYTSAIWMFPHVDDGNGDLINIVYGKVSGCDEFVLIRMCPWMLGTMCVLFFFLSFFLCVRGTFTWAVFYLLDFGKNFTRSCHVADNIHALFFPCFPSYNIASMKCRSIEKKIQPARINRLQYTTYICLQEKLCSELSVCFLQLFFSPKEYSDSNLHDSYQPKRVQDWVDLDVNLSTCKTPLCPLPTRLYQITKVYSILVHVIP